MQTSLDAVEMDTLEQIITLTVVTIWSCSVQHRCLSLQCLSLHGTYLHLLHVANRPSAQWPPQSIHSIAYWLYRLLMRWLQRVFNTPASTEQRIEALQDSSFHHKLCISSGPQYFI